MKKELLESLVHGAPPGATIVFHLSNGYAVDGGTIVDAHDVSYVSVQQGETMLHFAVEDIAAVAITPPRKRKGA